jgi:hypothetical protein
MMTLINGSQPPWALDTENILKSFEVQKDTGLDPSVVQERLQTFGPNRLKETN